MEGGPAGAEKGVRLEGGQAKQTPITHVHTAAAAAAE